MMEVIYYACFHLPYLSFGHSTDFPPQQVAPVVRACFTQRRVLEMVACS